MNFKTLIKSFLFSKQFVVVFLLIISQIIAINFAQMLIKTQAYNDQDQIRFALVAFLITLIFGGLLKAYSFFTLGKICQLHKEKSPIDFALKNFGDWVVTEVRVQIRVLIGLIFLIVPGIFEAIRLSLAVPYVFLDPRMKNPHFDPIFESRKNIPLNSPFVFPLLVFTLVLPVGIVLATNSDKIIFESTEAFLLGLFSALIQSLTLVVTNSYLLYVYLNFSSPAAEGES